MTSSPVICLRVVRELDIGNIHIGRVAVMVVIAIWGALDDTGVSSNYLTIDNWSGEVELARGSELDFSNPIVVKACQVEPVALETNIANLEAHLGVCPGSSLELRKG